MDSRRMCPHCRAFITSKDRVCPYCNEQVGPRAIDRRSGTILGGLIPHARFITVLLLTINFGLYLATVVFSMKNGRGDFMNIDGLTLFAFGAKFRAAIQAGQWWRLVTAGFLHGGILHILMNSWVLFDLGATVEDLYGGARMWVIFFIASVFGFYLSTWWSPALSVGASAGICGLLGAMIAFSMTHRSAEADAIRGMYVRWAITILIIGILPGFHIDNAAHIGGMASGFGVAYLAGTARYEGSFTERMWRVASWFCILLTVVSFLEMYLWFTRNASYY